MLNTNATRQKVLADIDQFGVAYVSVADLDASFRHGNHLANWVNLWNLAAVPATTPGLTAFTRRTTGNAVRDRTGPNT